MTDLTGFVNIASCNNFFFTNASNNDFLFYTQTSGQNIHIGTTSNNPAQILVTSNSTVFSSNVGIGKSNPAFTLDVLGDINFSGIFRQGGVPYIGSQWSNSAATVFLLTSNVGIGKSNPTFKLDVGGDINFDGVLRQGGVPYIGSQWSNSAATVFLLTSNVGIGKSNPTFKLDVGGDINFDGVLRQGGVPYIGSQWSNNSCNVFLLNSNVGIGTSNPTSLLTVAGDIEIRSNINLLNNVLTVRGMKVLKNSNPGVPVSITSTTTTIPGFSNSNNTCIIYTPSGATDSIRFLGGTTEIARFTGDGFFNVYGVTTVYSNIMPASNLVYDLGSSNMRFRSLYLASNTIDMGGTKLTVQGNSLAVTDSNNSNSTLIVNQIQIGTASNAVKLSLDASNNIQFQSVTLSNGVATSSSNAVVAGGWSNIGSNVAIVGSNVGIGTTNPVFKLDVQSASAAYIAVRSTNNATNANIVFQSANSNTHTVYRDNNNTLNFYNGSSTVMTLSNANVGIGVVSPFTPLHVYNPANSATLQGSIPVLALHTAAGANAGTAIDFYTYNNAPQANPASRIAAYDDGSFSGHMILYTKQPGVAGNSLQERMRINSAGNVGIGTTTPTSTLDVNGIVNVGTIGTETYIKSPGQLHIQTNYSGCNTFVNMNFSLGSNGNSGPTGQGYGFKWYIGGDTNTNGQQAMVLTNSGQLGIGTLIPSYALDVTGSVRSTSTYVGGTGSVIAGWAFNHNNNTTTTSSMIFGSNNATNASAEIMFAKGTIDTSNLVRIGFFNNSSLVNVMANGSVGIGTSTPAYPLDVNGTIRASNINIKTVSGDPGDMISTNYGTSDRYGVGQYTNGTVRVFASAVFGAATVRISKPADSSVGGTATFTDYVTVLMSSGNVGIGTTSPQYTLDVNGNINARNSMILNRNFFYMGGNGDYNHRFYNNFNNIDGEGTFDGIKWNCYGGWWLRTGSSGATTAIYVNGSGFVGLGTTNPSTTLDVNGTIQATNFKFLNPALGTGGSYITMGNLNDNVNYFTQVGVNGGAAGIGFRFQANSGSSPGSTILNINSSGIQVTGSLSKSSGTFDIIHPSASNKRLVHSFIEGPRCDLIYRGNVLLNNGVAVVNIDKDCVSDAECAMSEGTFMALCKNPEVFLQNKTSFDNVIGTMSNNLLTIICQNSNSCAKIAWMVIAERNDDYIREWSRTNSNGCLITEYQTNI